MLAPIEFSRIDDDASNGSSMTSDPLCCRVNNNIRAVLNRANVIAASSKCVVSVISIARRQVKLNFGIFEKPEMLTQNAPNINVLRGASQVKMQVSST